MGAMAPKARDRGAFRTGERVLVPHTDKFYVAKVRSASLLHLLTGISSTAVSQPADFE